MKTYYVIGNLTKVMPINSFSFFPQETIHLTQKDIINCLNVIQEPSEFPMFDFNQTSLEMFEDQKIAMEYAVLKSEYFNSSSAYYYQIFPPVIEVLLNDESIFETFSIQIPNKNAVTEFQNFLINPKDIEKVKSYWYKTGSIDKPNEISVKEEFDFNYEDKRKTKCIIM